MRFFISFLFCTIFSFTAQAQERSSAILILDASGSMWGQIDGKAKITIAQEVVGDLLTNLPSEQQLGLTIYGHRRKGDCTDIETVMSPSSGSRDTIRGAVNTIKPKGKTPMTDAVIAAAKSLRYTEERATVILVSDGIETCHPDPCAAARALEEAGVDFTAHVVGFNINDPEAIAQMQCLAEETGGTFKLAENAAELGAALTEIAAAPEPEPVPEPVTITFQARLGDNGPVLSTGLVWSFAPAGTGSQTDPTGSTKLELLPGDYSVSVLRLEDEVTQETTFSVADVAATVTVILPEIQYSAQLEAADKAAIGSMVDVTWQADTGDADYVSVARTEDRHAKYSAFAYVKSGNPVSVLMPLVPGSYELRYIRSFEGQQKLLATRPIEVQDLEVTLDAADQVAAGGPFDVTWDGPDYAHDYVVIAAPDDKDTKYAAYSYTSRGNPVSLTAPLEPGGYELRYVAKGHPDRALARRAIEVIDVSATLNADASAGAGTLVSVSWTGPDNAGDFVAVATPEAKVNKYLSYAYTKAGSPSDLRMPLDPGTYEVRYIANGNPDKVIATRPITVVALAATLEAAAEAVAGSLIEVVWSGPDNKSDFIALATPDAAVGKYESYDYTKGGGPAELRVPLDAGPYELRYIANGNPNKILATKALTVVEAQASVEAQDQAIAGSVVAVNWIGPDNNNDLVTVAAADHPAGKYFDYAYTGRGNPGQVTMPLDPGTYELRYVASGNPAKILARRPIQVVAAQVSLDGPTTATAGSVADIVWSGPDNKNDFIAVANHADAAKKYSSYQYTQRGSPAKITMPIEPGTYQLRYIANGVPYQVLATRDITVVAANVVLDAPAEGVVGTKIALSFEGPNNNNDYVSIAEIGSDPSKYFNYQYTNRGSPASLTLPDTPGTYLLRYVANSSPRKVLARRSIKVVEVGAKPAATAQLEASDVGAAGTTIEVFWVGPDATGDVIAVSNLGDTAPLTTVPVAAGNPAMVTLPDSVGPYIIRYLSAAGDELGRRPIEVN